MASNVMSASEAAEYLHITQRRVHQMLHDRVLLAVSEDPVLLDRADVEHVAHVQPRSPGRPVAAVKAWDSIAEFSMAEYVDEAALDGWRRKMRPRAEWHRYHAHRSLLPSLVASPLLVASGLRAAVHHGVSVEVDERRFIGYVAASDFSEVSAGIPVNSGSEWNVELGIVPDDAWRFGRSAKFVDSVTAWLDLEDHRERSARLMLEAVVASRD